MMELKDKRILGCLMLHTGAPYLAYALESVYHQVDHIVILYTDTPSQGFQADIPCPDTEAQLLALAKPFLDKITWVYGRWPNEAEHLRAIRNYTGAYKWVWRFDADEITPPGMVEEMIRQAESTEHSEYRVPFVHFWQSFSRVCRDGQMPVRLYRTYGGNGKERWLDARDTWYMLHFGYCQESKYILYKMAVSGHRPEWRKDWYEERWLKNAQEDLHPVIHPGHWNAEGYDKSRLPELLKRHPWFNADVIE